MHKSEFACRGLTRSEQLWLKACLLEVSPGSFWLTEWEQHFFYIRLTPWHGRMVLKRGLSQTLSAPAWQCLKHELVGYAELRVNCGWGSRAKLMDADYALLYEWRVHPFITSRWTVF